MAYEIPSDFVLPAGRLLVQADVGLDNPIGTIVRIGEDKMWGCFPGVFSYRVLDYTKLRRTIQDPDYIPPDPPEGRPDQLTIDYTRIIFNRLTAQEVKIDDEDYFLIHVNDILGLIPE